MGILFLVGPRASGKTTIGKALAKKLALPFADTDQHLLENAGRINGAAGLCSVPNSI